MGKILVLGEAGPSQLFAKIKAQRCDRPTLKNLRNGQITQQKNCAAPIYFNLGTTVELATGKYILGFENSIFPGLVEITSGKLRQLQLTRLDIPSSLQNEKRVRFYRDFSSLTEQRKIYFSHYFTGRHFFRLTNQYSFGDYYITDGQRYDNVQWRSFELCSSINSFSELREQAKLVCNTWNRAKSMIELSDLFKFESISSEFEGTFQEAAIAEPGDIQAVRHLRHLVAAPLAPGEFVSVFPGIYRVVADGSSRSLRMTTPDLEETYDPADNALKFEPEDPILELANRNECLKSSIWRTELRSYCTSDKLEGCDRMTAKKCDSLKIDLRFRKY